jgi:hypothetical protein
MLLARGWVEHGFGLMRKGSASLAYDGDVFLSAPGRRQGWTAEFPTGTPARVIVAAAEAAAGIDPTPVGGGSDA